MNGFRQRQDDIDTAAADWAARQSGVPLDAAEARALRHWLDQSPEHGAALTEAQAAWRLMGQVVRMDAVLAGGALPPRRRPQPSAWARAAALAAGILAAAWGGAALWSGDPMTVLAADYRTSPAQHRTVTLPDGSVVELGAASAIAVHYGDDIRQVELLSGQALFAPVPIAAAGGRPFVVATVDGTARALGTRFVVERLPRAVEVTVIEHTVEVAQSVPGEPRRAVVLRPGQSARYGSGGLEHPREVSPTLATAWQQGSLVFDRVPLDEVVAELSRYRHGRIVIGDPALAARTVSGVFDANDPDAALATIANVLGIHVAALPLVSLLY